MNTIGMKKLEAARNATGESIKADREAERAVSAYNVALDANIGVKESCVAARDATNASIKAARGAVAAWDAYDATISAA